MSDGNVSGYFVAEFHFRNSSRICGPRVASTKTLFSCLPLDAADQEAPPSQKAHEQCGQQRRNDGAEEIYLIIIQPLAPFQPCAQVAVGKHS